MQSLFLGPRWPRSCQFQHLKNPGLIVISKASNPVLDIQAFASDAASKLVIFLDWDRDREPAIDGVERVVSDQISMSEILEYCKCRRFCSVLVDLRGDGIDGVGELVKEAFEQNVLQKVLVEVLPFWDGSDADGSTQLTRIAKGLKAKNLKPVVVGQSIILAGHL